MWLGALVSGPIVSCPMRIDRGHATYSLHSFLATVPIDELPVAAAADLDSTIVAANQQFMRFCGEGNSSLFGQRLAAIVAERDRPALEEAGSRRIEFTVVR
jgi:hypothetical protein